MALRCGLTCRDGSVQHMAICSHMLVTATLLPMHQVPPILSRYIERPLLFPHGDQLYKFHMRVYYLVCAFPDRRRNRAAVYFNAEIAKAKKPCVVVSYFHTHEGYVANVAVETTHFLFTRHKLKHSRAYCLPTRVVRNKFILHFRSFRSVFLPFYF